MYQHVTYKEIECKGAVNKLKRKIPYEWDLNIYRGCIHGCKYCYALYSHLYMGLDIGTESFFKEIYVKTNIVDKLEKHLKSPKWNREIINLGGVTDNYQAIETKYKIMPDILKLLIKYKTPMIISTKSNLILRDFNLIDELSRITYVNVASTVTTVNEDLRKKIEPDTVKSKDRLEMLKEFRKTNASVGVHMMPIIPYITDKHNDVEELFFKTKEIDAHYILPGTLNLRGPTKYVFMNFLKREFPNLYQKIDYLYRNGGLDKSYKNELYSMINPLLKKYVLSKDYSDQIRKKMLKEKNDDVQLTFF